MTETGVYTETGDLTPEEHQRREAFAKTAMSQAGERTEDYIEPDYFGSDDSYQVALPGSRVQFVVIKVFTEGDRRKYLDRTNRDLKMTKTGEATLKTTPGSDRYELLKIAILDWHVVRQGQVIPFGGQALEKFLTETSPRVVDHIVKEINKHEPWLLAEMTVEDIEKEIEDLQEMLEVRKKEEGLSAQF